VHGENRWDTKKPESTPRIGNNSVADPNSDGYKNENEIESDYYTEDAMATVTNEWRK
jgi:hypothetical protein